VFDHHDVFAKLGESTTVTAKLEHAHSILSERYPFIARIAIAIYEPKDGTLETFVHSSGGDVPLSRYQAHLDDAPSLKEVMERRMPRVVSDLSIFSAGTREHTKRIEAQGYRSSYTLPMFDSGKFFGFLFFNSYELSPFDEECLHYLDLFGHLISLVIINEVASIRTLLAAVSTAREMTGSRDAETGAHIDRMARYARLIARSIATRHGFTDEYIEHVFLFAPLHDIGKIAVPDEILLKPAKLSEEEFAIMATHVTRGRQLVDGMLTNFGLGGFEHIDVLRNIVHYHHEKVDGSGYPSGLTGNDIPIEARIIAVADIFDALTSSRPYKKAWSNDDSFAALHRMAGITIDRECVEALESNREEVESIQARFSERSL